MNSQSPKTKSNNRPASCNAKVNPRSGHRRILPKEPYARMVPFNAEVKGGIVYLENGKIVKKEDVK